MNIYQIIRKSLIAFIEKHSGFNDTLIDFEEN